jgi:hypothetical protein
MADTQARGHELTTADLVSRVDVQGLPNGPVLVQGPPRDALDMTSAPKAGAPVLGPGNGRVPVAVE